MQEDQQGTLTFDFSKSLRQPLNVAIIMASGGHFAAAVFEGIHFLSSFKKCLFYFLQLKKLFTLLVLLQVVKF